MCAWSINKQVRVPRIARSVIAILAVAVAFAVPVSAINYGGGSVANYAAGTPLQSGTIVQLTGKDAQSVKTVSQSEMEKMFGVVVDRSQLAFTLTGQNLQNEVYVAASGTYNVLVSTQGGAIAIGDYLTLSSVSGVAMKAGTTEKTVLGRANKAFNDKSVALDKTTLKDVNGKANQTVNIGMVPVTIDVKQNPNDKSTETRLPDFLERVGQAVAEKEVSPLRMYLSLGITAVSLIMAISVLYAGIRNAVISIGRNPMSKKSIFRALFEVILTSFLILVIGLFAVYLLLKL